ncbi:Hypothetical protein CCH01_013210 [Clostridium chauvoei JF4335]|nr:Hypothetical protein CCH01_013210 [Clostridium chauvoei JF4335]
MVITLSNDLNSHPATLKPLKPANAKENIAMTQSTSIIELLLLLLPFAFMFFPLCFVFTLNYITYVK